jgi:hypothetical protein
VADLLGVAGETLGEPEISLWLVEALFVVRQREPAGPGNGRALDGAMTRLLERAIAARAAQPACVLAERLVSRIPAQTVMRVLELAAEHEPWRPRGVLQRWIRGGLADAEWVRGFLRGRPALVEGSALLRFEFHRLLPLEESWVEAARLAVKLCRDRPIGNLLDPAGYGPVVGEAVDTLARAVAGATDPQIAGLLRTWEACLRGCVRGADPPTSQGA